MTGGGSPDPRFASTLARGMSLLDAFRPSDDGLANAELSERTGLPRSTVSRLTFTLQTLGYLSRDGHRDRYRFGPALLALGSVAGDSLSFVALAAQIMEGLAEETRAFVSITIRDRGDMVVLKHWTPRSIGAARPAIGYRVPLRGSSPGHCLLAALPEPEFEAVVMDVARSGGFCADIARDIRADGYVQLAGRGFVISDRLASMRQSIHSAAVPFCPRSLNQPVIFSCGGPAEILCLDRLARDIGPKLRQAVADLERRSQIAGPAFGTHGRGP